MKSSLLAFAALSLLFAADAKDDAAKKEKEKLHGAWKVTSIEERGQTKDDNENHQLVFAGDELTVKRGDETFIKGKFKIDSSKKPMEIDFEISEAVKDNLKDKTGLGIYSLQGDTLKLCFNEPGASERPKEFAAQADTKTVLLTCQRQK
jgi:uncharacterized protein (TIGR03067 family)